MPSPITIFRGRGTRGFTAAKATDATEPAQVAFEELADILEILVQLRACVACCAVLRSSTSCPCCCWWCCCGDCDSRSGGAAEGEWVYGRQRCCCRWALGSVVWAAATDETGAAEAVDDGGAQARGVEFHVGGEIRRAERCGGRVAQRRQIVQCTCWRGRLPVSAEPGGRGEVQRGEQWILLDQRVLVPRTELVHLEQFHQVGLVGFGLDALKLQDFAEVDFGQIGYMDEIGLYQSFRGRRSDLKSL